VVVVASTVGEDPTALAVAGAGLRGLGSGTEGGSADLGAWSSRLASGIAAAREGAPRGGAGSAPAALAASRTASGCAGVFVSARVFVSAGVFVFAGVFVSAEVFVFAGVFVSAEIFVFAGDLGFAEAAGFARGAIFAMGAVVAGGFASTESVESCAAPGLVTSLGLAFSRFRPEAPSLASPEARALIFPVVAAIASPGATVVLAADCAPVATFAPAATFALVTGFALAGPATADEAEGSEPLEGFLFAAMRGSCLQPTEHRRVRRWRPIGG